METTIKVKQTKAFTTSDGVTHFDHGKAIAHERSLARLKNLKSLTLETGGLSFETEEEPGEQVVTVENIAAVIARNGDAILDALTVKRAKSAPAKKTA